MSSNCVFVRSRVGERMISACVNPTVKHLGVEVHCWWHSVIYLEFKAHLTSMATTAFCSNPIWFALSGTIICFSTGQLPNTPPGCVRTIWQRTESAASDDLASTIPWHQPNLRWFRLSWTTVTEKQPTSIQHTICRKSFKTVGKAFLMKLVERMPRVRKAVKAKGGYFEESQI